MAEFNARRISDPVHDTIGLSEIEVAVIASRAFQRLRNVKQLGLASFVFPGADYSRLSHCIGVCHVTGRILTALAANNPQLKLDHDKIQAYRLAGLLHDIGHYPFSHAMEDAIHNYAAKALLADGGKTIRTLNHEIVGKRILEHDPEIGAIFKKFSIDPGSVAAIFNRAQPESLTNLISSDLDADRIDYLLRTAHFSGLPYGNIDLEYLLTQLRLDKEGRVCLTRKAICAADHFLLSRYFDYQQVSFHKTVAALEMVLKDVVSTIIEAGLIDCTEEAIQTAIAEGTWAQFDDMHVWGLIRKTASEDSISGFKARSLLDRRVPKQIIHFERVDGLDRQKDFANWHKAVLRAKDQVSVEYDIDPALWYLWHKSGITLTKVGSRVPVGAVQTAASSKDKDRYEQSIRILGDDGVSSADIMSEQQSLMSILSNNALYALRLYVLLPPDKEGRVRDITKRMEAILNS